MAFPLIRNRGPGVDPWSIALRTAVSAEPAPSVPMSRSAVKPASTAAAATDLSLVVQLSPNGVGSASTPLSVVSNQSVGSGSFATAQASPGVAATLIAAARTGVSGTGRIAAIIINMSTVPVFLGASGVTTTTGSYLAGVVGAAVVIPTTAAIYGVVGSGTGSVSVQELY